MIKRVIFLRPLPKLIFVLPLLFSLSFSPSFLFAAVGKKAMVVTADTHATRVALEVLERGGNAVDAAIAAQWVLNVVEPQSSGIGGGGLFLYYEAATKRFHYYDGREKAPAEAYPEMFFNENHEPYPFYPDAITGGLPVGVPGTLKLLYEMHDKFGSKRFSFGDLFIPAIELAEEGFPVSERLSRYIEEEKDRLKLFQSSRDVFLDEAGNPPRAGDILLQPDLAKTFKLIQAKGPIAFYEGEIADAIVEAVRKAPFHPGLMKKDDLAYYKIKLREPVHGTYRDYDVFSAGPPSSGGSTLIEALNILELYQVGLHGRTANGIHLFSEAQKLAFMDRNKYLGDPDFLKIPFEEITSKKWAMKKAEGFTFDAATPTTQAAVRPLSLKKPTLEADNTHTSHISIVDERGNIVAFTTTIEYVFGSGMTVPGYGFILNNELTDFDLIPRDETGKLVANAPESDKRPRSSMTPTIVFKHGEPVLVAGSPGGSKIIGTVLNIVVNIIDFEMTLHEAVQMPRILNREGPIEMEAPLYNNSELRRELERRGHPITLNPVIGNVEAIYFDRESGDIQGESDSRGEGEALGY